jgi:hypothetical protein
MLAAYAMSLGWSARSGESDAAVFESHGSVLPERAATLVRMILSNVERSGQTSLGR